MKFVAIALFLIAAITSGAAIADTVMLFYPAGPSCADWFKSAADPETRWGYGVWFRGLVSGYNIGKEPPQQIMKMPSEDTIALFVDKYCRDHPLHIFPAAGFELIKELEKQDQ